MASTLELQSRPAESAPAPHPTRPGYTRVLADIAGCAPLDALADAQEGLDDLHTRLADLRGLKPATAALLFGSDAAWRGALGRVALEVGRRLTQVAALRRAAGVADELDFSLDEIARPIAPGAGVRWTGD